MIESTAAPWMPAIVESSALLPAVKLVARVIQRRPKAPILARLLVETLPGALRITGTDLDNMLSVDVPALIEPDAIGARIAIDAHGLAGVLAKVPKGSQIELQAAAGKLVLIYGRNRANMALHKPGDFPAFKVGRLGAAFTVPAAQLADDLAALAPCMSREETRYYMNGVYLDPAPAGLAMVATNGATLAVVDRAMPMPEGFPAMTLPRASVALLGHVFGKSPAGDVTLQAIGKNAWRASYGAATLTAKCVDGTFPAWRWLFDIMAEEELQRVAFPELEPRIPGAALAMIEKAAGDAVAIDVGAKSALVTCRARPDWLALISVAAEGAEAGEGKGWSYDIKSDAAREYIADLAQSRGLPVDAMRDEKGALIVRLHNDKRGMMESATFGAVVTPAGSEIIETPDYERLVMVPVERSWPAQYQDGAFSILFPREARAIGCAVTVDVDGEAVPLPTNAAGAIQLSADAVRRLAGDVADMPRRDIPVRHEYRNAWLPPGWVMPERSKADAAKLRERAKLRGEAYWRHCRQHPVAELVPVWVGAAPFRAWSDAMAAGAVYLEPATGVDAGTWHDPAGATWGQAEGAPEAVTATLPHEEAPEAASGPESAPVTDDPAPYDPALASDSLWYVHKSGAWKIGPSRRRSGFSVLVPLDSRDGFKGPASYLAEECNGRWHRRSGGYLLSLRGGNRFTAEWSKRRDNSAADVVGETEAAPADAEPPAMPTMAPVAPPPADDLAATVATLLKRVAALEGGRQPVAEPVETVAPADAVPIDATDWQAIAASRAAENDGLVMDLDTAKAESAYWRAKAIEAEARAKAGAADLAAMTAERDALARRAADRDRTAASLRGLRQALREAESMLAAAETAREASGKSAADAWKAVLAEKDRVAALESEAKTLRALAPLAGFRWGGGHVGATVTAERGPAHPAYAGRPAPRSGKVVPIGAGRAA